MEGTNLCSYNPCLSEADLDVLYVELFSATARRVLAALSAQNSDRTVTLYRACKRSGRTLVVDLYTAEVMEMLGAFAQLPQPGWPNLKVVVTSAFRSEERRVGKECVSTCRSRWSPYH